MNYKNLWNKIFPYHYKEKYTHENNLTGGDNEISYDISLYEDVYLYPSVFDPRYWVHKLLKFLMFTGSRYTGIYAKTGLVRSVEYFKVPNNIMLLVFNKSSVARLFVDASQTTFIDPGFNNYLTIELRNDSWKVIKLLNNSPIAQVIPIKPLYKLTKSYEGHYNNNKGLNESKFKG
jgi:deoxycytidine triphosphate deaminase